MKNIKFRVSKVVNGYMVEELLSDVAEEMDFLIVEDSTHIAATQDEVAKVVKKICHGAFTEGDPKERPSGDKK